jgi:hypothetical protein
MQQSNNEKLLENPFLQMLGILQLLSENGTTLWTCPPDAWLSLLMEYVPVIHPQAGSISNGCLDPLSS